LASPKSGAFVSNFAGQWLQIRSLELASPDHDLFRLFDESLRTAMRKETELLFESILRDNRSVLEFLTADYTFVNERLARHYGMDNIKGDRFLRVSLQGTPRRGVLTHGSVLTVTSNPTRTSPVKRGKWVLDNLLNSPPPPPPPNVPELAENKEKGLSGTLRERMVQHRANPNCVSCHERMDPIGFGLENFDPIGKWREKDGKLPIDSTGELSSGESFANARELLEILSRKKGHQFVRALSEKLLIYALGRGLEFPDRCAIDRIVANNARDNFRFSALLSEIIESTPFQMRRGETPAVSPVNSSSATASNTRE